MKIEIFKSRVKEQQRKLKARWTIEYDDFDRFCDPRFEIYDNSKRSLPYGVHCFNIYHDNLNGIDEWLKKTLDTKQYEVIGEPGLHIWFAEEKFRTLFLLKWSK